MRKKEKEMMSRSWLFLDMTTVSVAGYCWFMASVFSASGNGTAVLFRCLLLLSSGTVSKAWWSLLLGLFFLQRQVERAGKRDVEVDLLYANKVC